VDGINQGSGKDPSQGAGPPISMESNDLEIIIRVPSEVLFDTMQYDLRPSAKGRIDTVVKKLVLPQFKKGTIRELRIEGHADERQVTPGHPIIKDNYILSGFRAHSTLQYIKSSFPQIPKDRVSFAGLGADRPVKDPKNWDENRRVEFVLVRDLNKLPQGRR